MLTAARLSVASTTGSLVIARCAQAASELVARSEAGGYGLCYSLEAALTLSTIEADYESVRSQFKLNEPELLQAYRSVRLVTSDGALVAKQPGGVRNDQPGGTSTSGARPAVLTF